MCLPEPNTAVVPEQIPVVDSSDSQTTIHTWAHLALATHMKAGSANDPQVDLMSLKLSSHVSLTTL